MCGISIVIKESGSPARDLLKQMTDRISHRGPDDEGYYINGAVGFGHRRLSIIDLSSAGHQPMEREDYLITYNGEIYNYIELRQELTGFGHSFSSESDTEVILRAYQQWGTNAFSKFNGMWAFAIYDKKKQEVVFSRDHFGIKPLYYTRSGEWFLSGSEIKQFLSLASFKPVLNKAVAVNFLTQGWLNYSAETFFEGVNELLPGHYLVYNLEDHTDKIVKWYDLDSEAKKVTDNYKDAVKRVRKLFDDSVRIRMRSDVNVGSCLSGGIDSSAIVTNIHHRGLANDSFATITSCYEDPQYDEQEYSDEVTRQTGYSSVKVYPRLNNLWDEDHFDKMIYHQDQPLYSGSCYSEFNVFKTAREMGLIVMQDGQGSDEYLCGYGEFYISFLKELFFALRWRTMLREMKSKAIHRGSSLRREFMILLRSEYINPLKTFIKKIIGRKEYDWLSEEYQQIQKKEKVLFPIRGVRQTSVEEILQSSIPYQLHSEDRNSMMFSIESRLPFLDPRLVEYCIGLPSVYKIRNGFTKAVLRDAVIELPEKIKSRKTKMGFVAPDSLWILANKDRVRKELETLVTDLNIFSPEFLLRFDNFISGKRVYETIYFRALTLGRFYRIFEMQVR